MKALTVRVPEDLDQRFTKFCQEKGFKKGGLILSMLKEMLDENDKDVLVEEEKKAQVYQRPMDRNPLSGIGRLLGKKM